MRVRVRERERHAFMVSCLGLGLGLGHVSMWVMYTTRMSIADVVGCGFVCVHGRCSGAVGSQIFIRVSALVVFGCLPVGFGIPS